jgi:hypothetical protein
MGQKLPRNVESQQIMVVFAGGDFELLPRLPARDESWRTAAINTYAAQKRCFNECDK